MSLLQKSARKRACSEEGQAEEAERKLSKDSIRLIIAALRAALTEAVEKNLLPANPATRLGKLYREAGQVRKWTRSQPKKFRCCWKPPSLISAMRTTF